MLKKTMQIPLPLMKLQESLLWNLVKKNNDSEKEKNNSDIIHVDDSDTEAEKQRERQEKLKAPSQRQ